MSVTIPKISAPWLTSSSSRLLAQMFAHSAYTARFVGGVVRNALLGEIINDFDVATDAPPEQVMELAQKAGFKAIGTGLAHGTVTIIIEKVVFEITTLRVDLQTDGRHAQIAFTDDWRKDAARRDFTMNALYADFDGTIFDPLGGYEDLVARRVRFIGCAKDRIIEDYLRILRFFRFNAQYGDGPLDEPGLSACVRLQAGLSGLSAERIGAEFLRLLVAKNAAPVLKVMFAYGLILPLTGLVPLLHRFLNLLELEHALDRSPDAIERLGALFMLAPGNENRLAARLRLSNRQKYSVQLWGRAAVLHRKMSKTEARLALYKLGEDYQMSVVISWLRSGDARMNIQWRKLYDLPSDWQPPRFPLKGEDLVASGMTPGPVIGQTLRSLEKDWLVSDFRLDREELLKRAVKEGKSDTKSHKS